MAFWRDLGRTVGNAVTNAVSYVEEKNHKAAQINRLRTVISCEEKAAVREYIALGRYYYNNLRNAEDAVAEARCKELDASKARLDAAIRALDRLHSEEPADCCECEDECECYEIDLEDVETLDSAPDEADEDQAEAPAETDENDNLPFEG